MADKDIKNVKAYYDNDPEHEWDRFERHPTEFEITKFMMGKYIKSGDSVLDIGGGPGRCSIHWAKEGCDVRLLDLSDGNIELAKVKALEAGVNIHPEAANCLDDTALGEKLYDHVFLMGPLYHLRRAEDRIRAVELALKRVKPGGYLYCSFIMQFAGLIYDLTNGPGLIEKDMANEASRWLVDAIIDGREYEGETFTSTCYINQRNIEPFMNRFGMEKVALFGQESILAMNERQFIEFPESEKKVWLDIAKRLAGLPEYLSFSQHAMYIGRKPK